ncbi:MAG: bifunctional phosphopantothenoylcysteine decarboxylase/phosphopantothenate--cysteine ligase CoaBC [Atopobium sp.]|nr:bifunctional phosphopantothenoylcysteine decarboxylase/phosphopantothenate--cysteine ligase CoaBC [Atopobium sp.]
MSADQQQTENHVLLVVTGGIAAYKACEVLRGLQNAGCVVRVCMSDEARRFVGTTTFAALSEHRVLTGLFDDETDPIPHVEWAKWADLAIVVPATANVIAKIAAGIADDAATSTISALPRATALLVAPAMNVNMWESAATQSNVQLLQSRGAHFVGPEHGRLACGDVGTGKLASVAQIVEEALDLLAESAAVDALGGNLLAPAAPVTQDLIGVRILVTAGPTHEAIDPVRYISNASSGKMGFAIASAALARGAEVILVAGPCNQPTPIGVKRVDVISAAQMREAALAAFEDADVAICAAAVADYTPVHPVVDHKLKKDREHLTSIKLVETTDILGELCEKKGSRIVVGFAAETEDLVANARRKLASKGCDMIVANDVSRTDSTFGSDTNRVTFVSENLVDPMDTLPKRQVANELLNRVVDMLGHPSILGVSAKSDSTAAEEAPEELEQTGGLEKTVLMPAVSPSDGGKS